MSAGDIYYEAVDEPDQVMITGWDKTTIIEQCLCRQTEDIIIIPSPLTKTGKMRVKFSDEALIKINALLSMHVPERYLARMFLCTRENIRSIRLDKYDQKRGHFIVKYD